MAVVVSVATTVFSISIFTYASLFQLCAFVSAPRVVGQVGGRDNLLITRIKAPFSSFNRWLSAFKSVSCYRNKK